MIAYVTDIEGRWDKFSSFIEGNPCVSLVDGELAEENDQIAARPRLDRPGGNPEVAKHPFVDFHSVGVFLVRRFGSGRRRRGGLCGLFGSAAACGESDAREIDDKCFESHRNIAALASRSTRASAASNSASRY